MLELALNEACIPMCGRVGGGLAAIVLDGEQRWPDALSRSHHSWEDMSSFGATLSLADASTRLVFGPTVSEMEEGTDPKGRCNYCNVYAGRNKVKTCGRCRLVIKFARSATSDPFAHLLHSKLGAILLQRMPGGGVEDPQTEVLFYPPRKPRQ